MNKQVEFTLTKQLSASEDGNNIEAYLTTWGNVDKTGDIIVREALEGYVAAFHQGGVMLRMLYQHNRDSIICTWNELVMDEVGLLAKGEIFTDTSLGNDTRVLLRRGVLDSVSIGFKSNDYEYNDDGTRTFKSIELVEASVVDVPANSQAVVTDVKSADGSLDFNALKDNLRKSGLSKKQSEDVVHSVKEHWSDETQSKSEDTDSQNLSDLLDRINQQL